MGKASPKLPARETDVSELSLAVMELAQSVRVLTDVVQATRDELQWITRNGLPHQPLTIKIQPPQGTAAPTAEAVPAVEADKTKPLPSETPATALDLEEACEWLGEHLTALEQEQLHLILSAQDDIKRQIIAAIRGEPAAKSPSSKAAARPSAGIPSSPPEPTRAAGSRWLLFDDADPASEDEAAPVADPTDPLPDRQGTLPPVSLWEIGDAVEFCLDGRELWGEIVELDDARNVATVELIPAGEEIAVSQDLLRAEQATLRCGCIDPLYRPAMNATSSTD